MLTLHASLLKSHQAVKRQWLRAGKFDRIPADSMFVVLSDRNPHATKYNTLMTEFLRIKQQVRQGAK